MVCTLYPYPSSVSRVPAFYSCAQGCHGCGVCDSVTAAPCDSVGMGLRVRLERPNPLPSAYPKHLAGSRRHHAWQLASEAVAVAARSQPVSNHVSNLTDIVHLVTIPLSLKLHGKNSNEGQGCGLRASQYHKAKQQHTPQLPTWQAVADPPGRILQTVRHAGVCNSDSAVSILQSGNRLP
jgi:hypothetical protein